LQAKPRSWREALAVFSGAGRGLAAAHRAGLLHRDFKPDNVLVGADGRARVTDFGLARAALQPDPAPAEGEAPSGALAVQITQHGARLGTPAYMPPEQVDGRPLDARADQFAFCASVYEALHGRLPYRGETPEAVWAAARAGVLPESPPGGPPARVDAVIARGLRPDAAERFPSMDGLLEALDAAARPRRLARGALVAAGAGVLLAWVAVAVRTQLETCSGAERKLAGVWDAGRKAAVETKFRASSRSYREAALAGTERALDAYAQGWAQMRRQACAATRVQREQPEDVLALRMACLDQRLGELSALTSLLAGADDKVVERAVQAASALTPLDACADVAALLRPVRLPQGKDAEAALASARAGLAKAKALHDAGRFQDAVAAAAPALAQAEALGYLPLVAEVGVQLARSQQEAGDLKAAQVTARRAVDAAAGSRDPLALAAAGMRLAAILGVDLSQAKESWGWVAFTQNALGSADPGAQHDALSASLHGLRGNLYRVDEKYADALAEQEQALDLRLRLYGPDNPQVGDTYGSIGNIHFALDHFDQAAAAQEKALDIRRRALGDDHPDVGITLNNLSAVEQGRGRWDVATDYARRAEVALERSLGPDHFKVGGALYNLGVCLRSGSHYAEALEAYGRALRIFEKSLGPDHPNVAVVLESVGWAQLQISGPAAARPSFERALKINSASSGAESLGVALDLNYLGVALREEGRAAEAMAMHRRALAIQEKALGPKAPRVAETMGMIGRALEHTGHPEEALAQHRRALAALEEVHSERVTQSLVDVARVELALGYPEDCRRDAERAAAVPSAGLTLVAEAHSLLAQVAWASDRERARALAAQAEDEYRRGQAVKDADGVKRWLAAHNAGPEARAR
ncbi:MAG TPA: serine/threonine-protein kinase, partial [Myxococcaceae bacterium]|nr:serine/threonine-protein kinase [Myxococcaceae bacterium]